MKTKKFNKRLNLNKTTIANLINKEMKDVRGLGPCDQTQVKSCNTWGVESCLHVELCHSYPVGQICPITYINC